MPVLPSFAPPSVVTQSELMLTVVVGDRARAVPAAAGIGLHRAVVGERDVRGAGGLDEVDVGDLGPRLQRRQREELLRRIQPVDIVGDGVGSPVMGDGAVVLPEAVDEVVGKRRDRRDRLRSARNHRGHGIGRQRVRFAFIDEERVVRLLTRGIAARRCRRPAPQRSRCHRKAEWFFFIDQARQQVVRLRENRERTREARIASLTLVYQPSLSRACFTMHYGEKQNRRLLSVVLRGFRPEQTLR